MGAGEFDVYGPFGVGADSAIKTALSGSVLVADDIVSWVSDRQVWFGAVKAA